MIRLFQVLLVATSVIGFASATEEHGNARGWLSGMCCRRRRVGRHYIPNIDTDIVVRKAFSGERINEFKIELEYSYLLISIPKRAIDARYEESEIFNGDENIRIFLPANHSKLPLAQPIPRTPGCMILRNKDGSANVVKIHVIRNKNTNTLQIITSRVQGVDRKVMENISLLGIIEIIGTKINRNRFDRIIEEYTQEPEDRKIAFLEGKIRDYGFGGDSSTIPEELMLFVATYLKEFFDDMNMLAYYWIGTLLPE